MKTKNKILAAVLALGCISPAVAATTCGSGDLSGVSFITCAGYESGNLISTSPGDLTQIKSIFTGLGFANASTTWVEKLDSFKDNTIDFKTNINQTFILGVHKGGGKEEGTAFYVISGNNVDTFKYQLPSLSNAAIYSVGTISPVPEPSTWALALAGLSAVGFVSRRRKVK